MSFSYKNSTAATQYDPTVALGMATNYARVTDEPEMARVSNKTASIEQPELITYRCNPVNSVSTANVVRHPAPVTNGIQYTVKLETIDRIEANGVVYDEPIVAWLTIKHPASNNWNNEKVSSIVRRLISACLKGQTTSGSSAALQASNWRFEDLMRSALMPTQD